MKQILTIAFIIITSTVQAQLTETSVSAVPTIIGSFTSSLQMAQGELTSKIKDGDTTYTLKFRNDTNSKWNTVVFKETGGLLNSLFNILKSFFSNENKKNEAYKRTFKLGNEDVTCTNFRNTTTSILFKTNEGFFYIKERQLDKLFGK